MNDLDQSVESALTLANLDALLVTRDANQRYLEGYTGSECYLLISRAGRWLLADSRYAEQAGQECRTAAVVQHRDPFPPYAEVIAGLAREHGWSTIGFEKAVLSYGQYETIVAEEREHKLVLLDYWEFLKNPADWFVKTEHPSLDG